MKCFEEKMLVHQDVVGRIIRFAIAGQAHSDDLTTNGHYVCTDFIQYKDDTNRSIRPWITKLFFINKLFYTTTKTLLENYHNKPNQISNLVDFFCAHFQDSINNKGQEELPISMYLGKYMLSLLYVHSNYFFNLGMTTIVDCNIDLLLTQYQKDFDAFVKENLLFIDPEVSLIKCNQDKLERNYYIYEKLFRKIPLLPENIINLCLEKLTKNTSENKELLIIDAEKRWSFFLNLCVHGTSLVHSTKRCAKVHYFLKRIFSYRQLKNLQDRIVLDCSEDESNDPRQCQLLGPFIENRCNGNCPRIDDNCQLSYCFTRNNLEKLAEQYLMREISFLEFTVENFNSKNPQ